MRSGVESWKQTLAELAGDRLMSLQRQAFLLCGDQSQAEDLVQDALPERRDDPARRAAVTRREPGAGKRRDPMILDEQELRQQLAAAADHVSAPRFTVDGLISRIRRRRARILGLISGSLLAVAALAVAVPVALSGPGTPPAGSPPGLCFGCRSRWR